MDHTFIESFICQEVPLLLLENAIEIQLHNLGRYIWSLFLERENSPVTNKIYDDPQTGCNFNIYTIHTCVLKLTQLTTQYYNKMF